MTPSSETPTFDALPLSGFEAAGPRADDARTRVYAVAARVAYWAPVIVVVVLFAQVSFLGLRPALAEARRLSAAEEVLTARHAVASAENQAIALQLSARADPVFRERQRRLRTIVPAPVVIQGAMPRAAPAATTGR